MEGNPERGKKKQFCGWVSKRGHSQRSLNCTKNSNINIKSNQHWETQIRKWESRLQRYVQKVPENLWDDDEGNRTY